MQTDNTHNVILDDNNLVLEYKAENAIYTVNRFFGDQKTIKDIILENISDKNPSIVN